MKISNQRLIKVNVAILNILLILNILTYGNLKESLENVINIDELSIEELLNVEVKTASKKLEKNSDAPGIIEVISAQEIKAFGAISLFDLLQRASSIQPVLSHLYSQNLINIRGDAMTHYNNHVLFLIDGRPIRELLTGGVNSPILTSFPIDAIQRIEIVRGPGSVLYGTNAFSGVINIITKQDYKEPAMMLSLGGGTYGAITSSLIAGTSSEEFSAMIGARYFKNDGWNFKALTTNSATNLQSAVLIDRELSEEKIGLFSHLSYKKFQLSAFYSNFQDDSLGGTPYPNVINKIDGDQLFMDIGYNLNFSDYWSSNLNLTLNKTNLYFMLDGSGGKIDNSSWGYLGEISVNGKLSDTLNLIFGGVVDVRKNFSRERTTIDKFTQTHLSAYTQLDFSLIDELKLIAGAQLNKPHDGDIDIVPRLGLIYNLKNGLGFKALYGKAFRSAWPVEQLIQSAASVVGNPDLGPEKVGTLDIQIFYQNKTSRFSFTFFQSHFTDIVTRVPTSLPGQITYDNTEKMDISGIEFEAKISPLKNLFITGSAMYQKNKDNKTYSPHMMFKLGTSFHTTFGLNMGLFLTHFGKSLNNKGAELNPEATAINLLTLNFGIQPLKKLPIEFTLNIQNLLDEDYFFTEWARSWVNTFPNGPGRAIYSSLVIHL